MLTFFAHSTGEPHVEPPQTVDTTWLNILPFAGLVLIWMIMTYGFKAKLSTKLTVAIAYLLVIGIGLFQLTPVTSTVAIIIGFGLALATMLLQSKK